MLHCSNKVCSCMLHCSNKRPQCCNERMKHNERMKQRLEAETRSRNYTGHVPSLASSTTVAHSLTAPLTSPLTSPLTAPLTAPRQRAPSLIIP